MECSANYVYFVVNAANFIHSWQPSFEAEHSGGSTITEIAWAYQDKATSTDPLDWHLISGASGKADPVSAQGGNSVDEGGQCIVVRVEVEHGNVENETGSYVELTVNGYMIDESVTTGDQYINPDLQDLDDIGGVCEHKDEVDFARHNLTPRPKLDADDPVPFVLKP